MTAPTDRCCSPAVRRAPSPKAISASSMRRRRRPATAKCWCSNDLALARSLHARPHERREVVRAAGGDRRGHGRPDRRRGRRIARPGVRARRHGAHAAGLAALRQSRRAASWSSSIRKRAPPSCLPRRARHARHHRVVRPVTRSAQPKAGETVVVSAASGAVGSVVGQLAKIAGCRAVGIAGGTAKCDYVVDELGFDACIDYKAGNLLPNLHDALPEGRRRRFRERRRRDPRHGAARDEPALAHRRLRPHRRVQRDRSPTATRCCARSWSTASACRA